MTILSKALDSIVFWGAWILIPALMEIIPALCGTFLILRRRRRTARFPHLERYPLLSVIIPVYNAAKSLEACLESVHNSSYPTEQIEVYCVNNGSRDESEAVFLRCRERFSALRLHWLSAEQGKARAMNMALYHSHGTYIINLDSDGVLERDALIHMIEKFEAQPQINCMTGAILTRPEQIRAGTKRFQRLLRELEFLEYAQAFLAGRSIAAERDAVYTLSGAFSAFRKSAILSSQMYNTDTICEDTHMTFQMRFWQGERIEVCENALFLVDPIEDIDRLYTQRQRWQRGSMEVAKLFLEEHFGISQFFSNIGVRALVYDHSISFSRMVWYVAMLCLLCMNYSLRVVLVSVGMIYGLYALIAVLYFFAELFALRASPPLRRYALGRWWCLLLMPVFNLALFFMRLAGIINSISEKSAWRTRSLTEEGRAFAAAWREMFARPIAVVRAFRAAVNRSDRGNESSEEAEPIYSTGWYVCVGAMYMLGILLLLAVYWSRKTFGVGIGEIINTLRSPLDGAGNTVVSTVVKGLLLPLTAAALLLVGLAALDRFAGGRMGKRAGRRHRAALAFGVILLLSGVVYGNRAYGLLDYYAYLGTQTGIYEELYVNPAEVAITADGPTRNLIYIYVESLETSYASEADGGFQAVNYMPGLTALADDYLNFADVDNMGGFHTLTGAGWTMAAILATTAGIPYALPTGSERATQEAEYMPGLVTLGDILEQYGYRQEFLCGSDGHFAGRDTYFTQHGGYAVCDIYAAREKGYLPEDYWNNWGFEDKYLFDIAKEELLALAACGDPFNFTLLTVDLHAPDGELCPWCGDTYEGITPNVVACTDRQVSEFVAWCQEQSFYEDTVIVITGDHPRMDSNLVEGRSYYERTIYNCFLNSAAVCARDEKSRTCTTVDIFPTVLAAMGFRIEGDRLGLGTNLFSVRKTLAESRGYDWLNQELSKSSDYYVKTFAPNLS